MEINEITSTSIKDILIKESNDSVKLRLASERDIPTLLSVINSAYLYENEGDSAFKIDSEARAREDTVQKAMEDGLLIVATDPKSQGAVLGCIQYDEIPKRAGSKETAGYFGLFAVNPEFQGQGTGKKLMQTVESIAIGRGMDSIQIQVVNHSQHLINLYEKYGYTRFGKKEWSGKFLTKPTHFVLMEKELF